MYEELSDSELIEQRQRLLRELSSTQKQVRRRHGRSGPQAPALSATHLEGCRLFPDRYELIRHLPPQPVIAELGTAVGVFARSMMETLTPQKLHLFDLRWVSGFDRAYFQPLIDGGQVELHTGDSSSHLAAFPDEHFDMIYIDGDHGFDGAKRDCEIARTKVKRGGWLGFNDYVHWSVGEMIPYGVVRAVNELCVSRNWRFGLMAMPPTMHIDVFLQRPLDD